METFERLREQFLREIETITSIKDIESIRLKFLGRKGFLAEARKSFDFATMSPEIKAEFGRNFNELKELMENSLAEMEAGLKVDKTPVFEIDMTLPGTGTEIGSLHPISLVQRELEEIFTGMGFKIEYGFEAETEYYNFEALNIPSDHPAREMQDTFWFTNGMLLRTHTSPNQIRAMEKYGVPLRVIAPGRCFRYESIDATHENTFFQLEGLMVDRNITVSNLISVMRVLLSQVFHRDVETRLRPGFFPFVEPGFELDIKCLICGGEGCRSCKGAGWLELLPCGMVHPNVLKYGGVDPDKWSGFAFGLGMTRLAMMKYGIPDIRLFNSGDIRMLEQFNASV